MIKETLMFDRDGNLTTDSKIAVRVEVIHRSEGGTIIRHESFYAKGHTPQKGVDERKMDPNATLTENGVPGPGADWSEIEPFAYSFGGYKQMGSFEKCAKIGNRTAAAFAKDGNLPDTLIDLRTALFFEQRRWRHFGQCPDEPTMVYIHALVEAIRRIVKESGHA